MTEPSATSVAHDADSVRARILAICGDSLAVCGIDLDAPPADLDLRTCGAIDSLGFLELITELEETLGIELELDEIDPEQLTMLEPLARNVSAQAAAQLGSSG